MDNIIDVKSVLNNNFVLSPNNYNKTEIKSLKAPLLSEFVTKIDKGTEVGGNNYVEISNSKFIRTAALSNKYFSIYEDSNSILSINSNSFVNHNLKKNDILICKDSNVGEVVLLDKDYPNYMFSSGINRLHINKNPLYVFAIMKNQRFKDQLISFIPKGATLMHAKDNYLKCAIPLPENNGIIDYVSSIVNIIQNKEIEIKRREELIEKIISAELNENQKAKKFEYRYPTIDMLLSINRLDTGNYTEEFFKADFMIKNYNNGYFYIDPKKIKGGNTPKKRVISQNKNLKYLWITPTFINDNGTMDISNRINCEKNNINSNCLLIINRTSKGGIGEYVGISSFYDFELLGSAQHNQGIYKVIDKSDEKLIFMACLLNSKLYRRYCANISMGSKMKELKLNNILSIPFPNFPETIIKKVNNLYYNKAAKRNLCKEEFEVGNKKWDDTAGLIDLYNSSENFKNKLNEIIDCIYEDKKIEISYSIM